MSDTGRDNDADSGRSANAPVAPSYATLRRQNLEPLITDKVWHSSNESGFHQTVVGQYRFSEGIEGAPRSPPHRQSDSDTMSLMTAYSHDTVGSPTSSTYSAYTPSLGHYQSDASSLSARTSNAEDFLRLRLIDDDGVPEEVRAPQQGALACAYGFLACQFHSNSFAEWDTHCKSHFQGHLPKIVHCPFKCNWFTEAASGEEAWDARNAHVVAAHSPGDAVDQSRRPDTTLIDHLWRSRIVDSAEVKELRKYGHLNNGNIFLRSAGVGRDRRRERRPGG